MGRFPITEPRPLPERASVLGLGRTGISTTRYLAQNGVDVLASDQRTELPAGVAEELRDLGATISLGANQVREGDLVVISPGIAPHNPLFQEAHDRGSEVISEPELFARQFNKPIIAITGTDGKSTVTTWTAHLLNEGGVRAVAGGNLGNPLVDELSRPELEVAVLEISAFQLITTPSLVPAVAAVTNLADDHLDYFDGDAQAYANAKKHLVDLSRPETLVILPSDNEPPRIWSDSADGISVHVGLERWPDMAGWLEDGKLMIQLPGEAPEFLIRKDELRLVGLHNVRNALYASLIARWFGVTQSAIRHGLASYEALPHRCRVVRRLDGVRYINDSKATTPNATMAALSGIEGSIVLIVGGSDKGSDYTELGAAIREQSRLVIAMGATAHEILDAVGPAHPQMLVSDLQAALSCARERALAGDVVLLSPACASFDQFKNYGHRGDVFTALVEAM